MAAKCNIHWFRKGLRLHDNPALLAACEGTLVDVRPIFILDPWFVKNARVGVNRWRFLIDALRNLDENLRKINSRLYVVRGEPKEVFTKLFNEWNVAKITFEVDTEPYAKRRDLEIEALAKEHGVEVTQKISHTLYDTSETIKKNGGTCPLTYQRCLTVLSKMGPVAKPVETVTAAHIGNSREEDEIKKKYLVPSVDDLGFDGQKLGPVLYPGGETEALERMERNLKKTNWICAFEKPQTSPNSLEPSTTVLSPYLKFGCLSPRLLYWKLQAVYSGKKHSQPPVSLHGQLLWREFFYTVGDGTPNFDKMEGNPVCRQIPWDNNEEYLDAWTHARTGYPFIDAIMTQLRQEGWIHHLARHAVACFLTRGDLWISWEEGMKVFEELLLDADWSLNAGNWMWLSASAFFHQYFRVYSPIVFGKKTDKGGSYIKKYLPQLKKFPEKYIYEPWTAPLTVQQAAGCIIGKDYPKPIVVHEKVSKINIKRMAEAYAQNKAEKEGSNNETGQGTKRKKEGETKSSRKKNKPSGTKKITDFVKN